MAVIVVDAITQHGAELDAYEIADVLPCLARSASAARGTARPANDFALRGPGRAGARAGGSEY